MVANLRVKLKKILKARARQRLNLETVKDEMVARDYRNVSVGFGWLVDEVVWACTIAELVIDVDI